MFRNVLFAAESHAVLCEYKCTCHVNITLEAGAFVFNKEMLFKVGHRLVVNAYAMFMWQSRGSDSEIIIQNCI